MTRDRLISIEWLAISGREQWVRPESILDLVERIRFLEARQSELQGRNTELVLENRTLKTNIEFWKSIYNSHE